MEKVILLYEYTAHIVLSVILEVFFFQQVLATLVKYVFLEFEICTRQYFKDF